ncbi:hypothetical protein CYMTET_38185 [Cymbomonas tetramitiformis]|uniref:Uncharacterized protein n=1 Tax=Cymbomonas tetramitiformis TaxID=36881 RepID=A0AAE0CER1_9CHLO|nr:hypothetical protein CYMTET_38185 [Cymbomonas tetramitiformis]
MEEALIREYQRRERKEFQKSILKFCDGPEHSFLSTNLGDTKIKPPCKPSVECLPIYVSELVISTTHRSRLLRGQLVDKPVFTGQSVGVLLRDGEGTIVKVHCTLRTWYPYNWEDMGSWQVLRPSINSGPFPRARLKNLEILLLKRFARKESQLASCIPMHLQVAIYNWHGASKWEERPMEVLKTVDAQFAEGALLGVREPHFERFADGTCGVRVDDPSEVIWLQDLGAPCAPSWQSQGNSHFRMKQYKEALQCYAKGLRLVVTADDHLLVKLMSNIANSYVKLRAPAAVLPWAAAVTSLIHEGPLAAKAWYRIGQALEQQQLINSAQCVYKHAAAVHESCSRSSAEAVARLRSLSRDDVFPAGKHAHRQVLAQSAASCSQEGGLPRLSASTAKKAPLCADPCALKDAGNAAFRSGQYAAALKAYVSSLEAYLHEHRQISKSASKELWALLANSAQCHLALGEHLEAVQCASAVVLMNPEHIKAHYRRAAGLLHLDHVAAAQAACQQGLRVRPEEKPLLELEARITGMSKAGRSGEPGGAAPTQFTFKPPKGAHGIDEQAPFDVSSVEEVAMMNQMLEMTAASGEAHRGYKDALDLRIPPFHAEFAQCGSFPPGCNSKKGARLLWSEYEHGRCTLGGLYRLGIGEFQGINPVPQPEDLAGRLGRMSNESLKWYFQAPLGSYRPPLLRCGSVDQSRETTKAEKGHKAVRRIAQCRSFSKTTCRREVLALGTIHVAVGFVDLSNLLFGTLVRITVPDDGTPLRWVGYERSPYACAKTAVIARLFEDLASEEDILQVRAAVVALMPPP